MNKFLIGLVVGAAIILGVNRAIQPYLEHKAQACNDLWEKTHDGLAAMNCMNEVSADARFYSRILLGK